jgi:hypothetical protein
MPTTRINCPNCRQPITAEIDQLFDVTADPAAKQVFLSGAFNLVRCPMCGYQGSLATPIVYHDADKELLLTFVPPEIGLPRDEQERLIGSMMNQVINKLPQEKRKSYLLRPQSTLTLQGLVERVLEADGITREMIQAQQQRLSLAQRLANAADPKTLEEIARQEDALIDAEFFSLLTTLGQAALASGDQEAARRLSELQKSLIPITTFGRELQAQSQEIEQAVKELQALGKDLNRENLLELVIQAPNETRLKALASLARPAMDYTFFQMLSERIDRARGEGRSRLVEVRSQLLEVTQAIDRQLEQHVLESRQLIEAILNEQNVAEAMAASMPAVDELFIQELNRMLGEARGKGDLERSAKLQQMADVVQQSISPPGMALVEEYLDAPDEAAREQFLQAHSAEIDENFMDLLGRITLQVQSSEEREIAEHVTVANRHALRFSMKRSMGSG